jgi:hypothetical protein
MNRGDHNGTDQDCRFARCRTRVREPSSDERFRQVPQREGGSAPGGDRCGKPASNDVGARQPWRQRPQPVVVECRAARRRQGHAHDCGRREGARRRVQPHRDGALREHFHRSDAESSCWPRLRLVCDSSNARYRHRAEGWRADVRFQRRHRVRTAVLSPVRPRRSRDDAR